MSGAVLKTISILFSILLIITIAWALISRDPHDFEGKCLECHLGLKDPAVLTRGADYLCLSCHPAQKKMTHPTGMVVRRKVPSNFKIYNGKMLCITCHIAHRTYDESDNSNKQFDSFPSLLRFETAGKLFCFQCHDGGSDGFTVNKIDSHAMGYGKAHVLSHDVVLRDILDDGSRECLSCHDGTLSRDASVNASGVNWEHSGTMGVSHPIGVDYNDVYRRKRRRYNYMSALDKRVKLFNGKIGCQTCHDHYSQFPHLLVMENKRSKLCLTCHNL